MSLSEKNKALANDIRDFLKKHNIIQDTRIYFNNICYDNGDNVIEDINPLDFFQYANPVTVSMSFEGGLYDVLNYGSPKIEEAFLNVFKKHGMYYELGNAWNLAAYPIEEDDEYKELKKAADREKEPEPIIVSNIDSVPQILKEIQLYWGNKANNYKGNTGSCVLGAGFKFKYDNIKYFMGPKTFHQGSLSWEHYKDEVEQKLIEAGCKDISYDWGVMD